jgi:type I restriction enzyme S subunit
MNLVPLISVADVQLGKMLSPKAKTGSSYYPYLRNTNVQWGRIDTSDLAQMDFSEAERKKFELRFGDLLVCEGGEPGRCAVWRNDIPGCYYQKALHRVRPHAGRADPEFLSLWIQYQAIKGAFENQHGKTTIAHLPQVQLEQFLVPDLDFFEQRRTAARLKEQLAKADCAQKAAMAQLDGVESLLAAIYSEAFAQIVPVTVPPTLDNPPAGWQWYKVTDLARLESGHTPSRSRPDWWGGDVSWISLTEIRALDGHWVESTQLRTNAAGIANSAARILPRGTVCFSRTASVGFVAVMAKPMATSQDFANWVCGDGLDPEFLMHALIRARKELRDLATGATHKTIYMPTLKSFHICAPDINTQRRIVRDLKQRLAEASKLRAALAAQQAELTKLPQRLLAQAFEN